MDLAGIEPDSRNRLQKDLDLMEHLGSVEDLLKTSPEILIEQF